MMNASSFAQGRDSLTQLEQEFAQFCGRLEGLQCIESWKQWNEMRETLLDQVDALERQLDVLVDVSIPSQSIGDSNETAVQTKSLDQQVKECREAIAQYNADIGEVTKRAAPTAWAALKKRSGWTDDKSNSIVSSEQL